jgi:phosphatidate cytidylyltransferase
VDEQPGSSNPDDKRERRAGEAEGVRIIGAEEAAEAMERGDVATRRPDDVPRYGDRPAPPPEDGPRPAIRFPLSGHGDPEDVDRQPLAGPDSVIRPPAGGQDTALPHWTEPATGEVPRIFVSDEPDDDLDAWSTFSSSSPRWRDSTSDYDDDYDDVSQLGDDETRIGALDSRDRPHPNDFFAPDEVDVDAGYQPGTRTISSDPRRAAVGTAPRGGNIERNGPGRDVPLAVGVGVTFGLVALLAFWIGPWAAMVLVVAVLGLGSLELLNGFRRAGFQPATLFGAAAAVSLALGAYYKGEVAYPLVTFLTVVFGLLWYWLVTTDRVVPNLGITLLGIAYVGGLGSFAALLLRAPDGIGLLLGAVIPTVAYDVGGFVVGRNAGRAPLTDISPNKTVEGLLGGMLCALVAAVVIVGFISPWSDRSFLDKAWLGFIVAIAASLGDLCESLLKRDLGVKDMGDILPGHGGVLDRFDALLFALPSVYYLALIILK